MGTAATVTHQLIHNLILRPLRHTTATPTTTTVFSLPFLTLKPSLSLLHVTRPFYPTLPRRLRCTLDEIAVQPNEEVTESEEVEEGKVGIKELPLVKREVPVLSVKERKELGSYAHSLGDKLKSQQIGKSGVTNNTFFAFDETLEKNEFLKLKIHRNCPEELEDVVTKVEQGTGSVVVGQIGRTVILYRPSITKLKAAEKKEQNRRLFEQRKQKFQAASQMRKKRESLGQPGNGPFARRRSEKVPS